MNKVFCIGAVMLLLAACGTDEPATPSSDEAPVAEQDAAVVESDEATSEPAESDAAPEIVEESASEAAPEEEAIQLAPTTTAAPARDWQFRENQHYTRLVPTQPTVGGADKIEVAEFFWYGCPHCFDFEPFINRWAENKPANVRFVRIPATWNRGLMLHAQLYYTEEVLARNGVIKDPAAFREAVFVEYHRRGNRLASEAAIKSFFARFDVSSDDFDRTWKSFEVNQKLRVAEDLARRYGIANVPVVVVNGKYRSGGAEAGSYPRLLDVIDELVARESVR